MKQLALFFSALAFVALVAFSPVAHTSAAPAAAVTPVAVKDQIVGTVGGAMRFFNTVAVTEDTRICQDLSAYRIADIQYVIDQNTTNTVTLKLQHSNNNSNFTDGQNLVAANAADANALNRYDLYGKYNCVYADVANSNSLTLTVIVLPRS